MALKRSALKRGTSQLKRSALERSGKPLGRRTALKQGKGLKSRPKRESAAERKVRDEWKAATLARSDGRSMLDPDTRADDAHHCIEKQRLKRDGRHDLLWDPDLGMALSRDEHGAHHGWSRRIFLDELPDHVVARARALGYDAYLTRTYPTRGAGYG